MKLFFRVILVIILVLVFLYLIGSRPAPFEVEPVMTYQHERALKLVQKVEQDTILNHVRPGNGAQIHWADSVGKKTKYALLYLHGFTASHAEGYPVHRALAKRYGLNLYLARLHDHGLVSDEPLKDFEADEYVKSAQDALQIAQFLGEDIIVMGTSTGASVAIYLAAHNPELLDVLLFFAPNIDVADPRSALLTCPWGKELAELLEGEYLKQGREGKEFNKYWYPEYRTESAVELMSLLDQTMTDAIFEAIEQPTFISFYYKNEDQKDDIISVDEIYRFFESISSAKEMKRLETVSESESHVVICNLTSKDVITPFNQVCQFLEEVVKLNIRDSSDVLQYFASDSLQVN